MNIFAVHEVSGNRTPAAAGDLGRLPLTTDQE